MQGHAACAVVFDVEPTLLHDSSRASIQAVQSHGETIARQVVALMGLHHGTGLVVHVGQVGDGAIGLLAVFVGRGV